MRVLLLADIDDLHWRYEHGHADLVISLGDTADCLILEAAAAFGCDKIFALKGNHCSPAPFPKPIIDLDLHVESFGGLTFGGLSGCWKYKNAGHFLYEQDEVQEMLTGFPRVDIFCSHNSPLGIHDKPDDIHTGFDTLNWYIAKHKPKILFHGHQHVNRETVIGSTRVIGVYGQKVLEL